LSGSGFGSGHSAGENESPAPQTRNLRPLIVFFPFFFAKTLTFLPFRDTLINGVLYGVENLKPRKI
jgi:hypothetical protein